MSVCSQVVVAAVFVVLQSVVAASPPAKPGNVSASALVDRFDAEPVFWRQLEIAQQIVALGDKAMLPRLERWLSVEDRHARGNAAFIFAGLGDPRGLPVIHAILTDFADRPEGQHVFMLSNGYYDPRFHLQPQIREDRYHAAHLLGLLKDRRAVPWLIPVLTDESVNCHAAWALGEIGGTGAIDALIDALNDRSPDMRAAAIYALQQLRARKAVPRLRAMLNDTETTHTDGLIPVGTAARAALAVLQAP